MRTRPEAYWAGPNSALARDIPTGDAYAKKGEVPWISEMYGYAFAAAEVGVGHVFPPNLVGYVSARDPAVVHYGIDFKVGRSYTWNKLSFALLRPGDCPERKRFFGPPPGRREVEAEGSAWERDGHALGAWTVNTINRGLCHFYRESCGDGQTECPPEVRPEQPQLCSPGPGCCRDLDLEHCWMWALGGECERNKGFMSASCAESCGLCAEPSSARAATGDSRLKARDSETPLARGQPGLAARRTTDVDSLRRHLEVLAFALSVGLLCAALQLLRRRRIRRRRAKPCAAGTAV